MSQKLVQQVLEIKDPNWKNGHLHQLISWNMFMLDVSVSPLIKTCMLIKFCHNFQTSLFLTENEITSQYKNI